MMEYVHPMYPVSTLSCPGETIRLIEKVEKSLKRLKRTDVAVTQFEEVRGDVRSKMSLSFQSGIGSYTEDNSAIDHSIKVALKAMDATKRQARNPNVQMIVNPSHSRILTLVWYC